MAIAIDLTGRVALVTGGSRGIGRGIALALADAGADVAVNYNRDGQAAEAVVTAIRAKGCKAEAYCASVEDRAAMADMVESVVRDFGGLSILVNNAGIASRGKGVADTDPDEFERVMRIHATSSAPFVAAVHPAFAAKCAQRYCDDFERRDIAQRPLWRAL